MTNDMKKFVFKLAAVRHQREIAQPQRSPAGVFQKMNRKQRQMIFIAKDTHLLFATWN